MSKSKIEWTESSWNPLTGCTKISPGCKNCYAERMAKRLQAMGQKNYVNGFDLTLHPHALDLPLKWKTSQTVFVNSMSDLFHDDVPLEYIQRVFNVMNEAYWHNFQVLTKRSERLMELSPQLKWGRNIWMGVSIENNDYAFRAEHLKKTKAHIKFISMEPLIGPVKDVDLKGIDWVIVGGESGPGARPMLEEWVIEIRNGSKANRVPFFFKQWGGVRKKAAGRELQGLIWDEMPMVINNQFCFC